MLLPKFEHLRPSSVEEAIRLLKEYGSRAQLVAGGTDLFPRMKYRVARPEAVITLKGISAAPPKVSQEGTLQLDALTTLNDLVLSPLVKSKAPLLAEAALQVGSNQIRNMATLGGNLCLETRCSYYNQSHTFQFVEPCFKRNGDRCYLIPKGKRCQAVFMADTVPALICLGAKAEIKSTQGTRQVSVEQLYTGDALRPLAVSEDEIVSQLFVPPPAPPQGTAFGKFSPRGGLEFGAVTVAVRLDVADDRVTCLSARIVVGCVGPAPVRALETEKALEGHPISQGLLREAADLAAREIRPVMHHGYSIPFLKECLKVQAFRTLCRAAQSIP